MLSTIALLLALTSVSGEPATLSPEVPLVARDIVRSAPEDIPEVPFYSQFTDISSVKWRKVGCGIASLAMIIDYYNERTVSVDELLEQGIESGAYLNNAGWTHSGLIKIGNTYDLEGKSYDLRTKKTSEAFRSLADALTDGPVMVSIHYKFDPKSTIPHLVVINGIKNDIIYYNDPAGKEGAQQVSQEDFLRAWKKKYIVLRPNGATVSIPRHMGNG